MAEENIWAAISFENWNKTPATYGKLAKEDDVKAGRAVFYLKDHGSNNTTPYTDIKLPSCAILKEESGNFTNIVIIQIENAANQVIVGYRMIQGGNGACTLPEITVIGNPTKEFFK